MCGASLTEAKEHEPDEARKRRIPSWIGSVVVAVLALVVVGAGGFGLYTMLSADPEPDPTVPAITPSPTSTPLPTSTPTSTPIPTPTPTPLPPRAHDVEEGETLSDIAELYDVTMDEILALNPDLDPELIKAGQVLLVPAEAPTSGPSDTGETGDFDPSSNEFVVHVVSAGETLSSIAEEYDVPISVIRAANDLSPEDETIRAEQSLVIPMSTPTPSPTPTAAPNEEPTPVPPYAAPSLLYPANGAVLADDAPVLLQWASVSVLADDEWYELRLRQASGGVVSSTVRTRATAWRVPLELLARAETDAPRIRWSVRVVREVGEGAYEEAGAASATRAFVWEGLVPTQSPAATPTS